MSYLNQFDDRALKLPIIMEIVSLRLDIAFIKTSKLLKIFQTLLLIGWVSNVKLL